MISEMYIPFSPSKPTPPHASRQTDPSLLPCKARSVILQKHLKAIKTWDRLLTCASTPTPLSVLGLI